MHVQSPPTVRAPSCICAAHNSEEKLCFRLHIAGVTKQSRIRKSRPWRSRSESSLRPRLVPCRPNFRCGMNERQVWTLRRDTSNRAVAATLVLRAHAARKSKVLGGLEAAIFRTAESLVPGMAPKAADRKNVKPDFEKPAARTPSAPKDWGAKADKPREIRKLPPIKRDLDRSR